MENKGVKIKQFTGCLGMQNLDRKKTDDDESSTSTQTDSSLDRHLPSDTLPVGPLPIHASLWTSRHLKLIGVSYSSEVSDLAHFTSLIQKNRELPVSKELPEIGITLIELTKEAFSVSFKCGNPRSHLDTSRDLAKLSSLMSGFSSQVDDFRERHSGLLTDSANFR